MQSQILDKVWICNNKDPGIDLDLPVKARSTFQHLPEPLKHFSFLLTCLHSVPPPRECPQPPALTPVTSAPVSQLLALGRYKDRLVVSHSGCRAPLHPLLRPAHRGPQHAGAPRMLPATPAAGDPTSACRWDGRPKPFVKITTLWLTETNSCLFRISDKHASFTNSDGKVTVTPHGTCKVVVNGVPIATKTKLQHLVNFPASPQDFLRPPREGAGVGAARGWGVPAFSPSAVVAQ